MRLTINGYMVSQALSWSPDGKFIAHFGDLCGSNTRKLYLWRVKSGEVLDVSIEHAATLVFKAKGDAAIINETEVGMTFSSDSSMLAIGGDKKVDTLKLVDTIGMQIVYETEKLGTPITALEFSPDMSQLVSGGLDGVLRIWVVVKNSSGFSLNQIDAKQLPGEIIKICYSEKGSDILVAYKFDNQVGICRLKLS
jgi:WD40 repeat protein